MSILIRNMEMPSCCAACKVLCDAKSETGIIRPFGERLPNCPLIEIPSQHGDLIDRDALMDALTRAKEDDPLQYKEDYFIVSDWLCVTPTVIEAEEVYGRHTDTAGNFHWRGTHSGEHVIKAGET